MNSEQMDFADKDFKISYYKYIQVIQIMKENMTTMTQINRGSPQKE